MDETRGSDFQSKYTAEDGRLLSGKQSDLGAVTEMDRASIKDVSYERQNNEEEERGTEPLPNLPFRSFQPRIFGQISTKRMQQS